MDLGFILTIFFFKLLKLLTHHKYDDGGAVSGGPWSIQAYLGNTGRGHPHSADVLLSTSINYWGRQANPSISNSQNSGFSFQRFSDTQSVSIPTVQNCWTNSLNNVSRTAFIISRVNSISPPKQWPMYRGVGHWGPLATRKLRPHT